jgi:hypothetical protein
MRGTRNTAKPERIGVGELDTHQQSFQPADHEKRKSRYEITDAQLFVINGCEPSI